jgi:hypothetical protein
LLPEAEAATLPVAAPKQSTSVGRSETTNGDGAGLIVVLAEEEQLFASLMVTV